MHPAILPCTFIILLAKTRVPPLVPFFELIYRNSKGIPCFSFNGSPLETPSVYNNDYFIFYLFLEATPTLRGVLDG